MNRFSKTRALVAALFLGSMVVAVAQPVVYFDQAFLYLPDDKLRARIDDVEAFINYIGHVQEALESTFASMPTAEPVSFGLIVTVRANSESKVWFSVQSGSLSESQREHISSQLESIPAPNVNHGVVPFAFALRAWGATDVVEDFPVAPEWAEFVDGSDAVDVIEKAWN